jgi:hypothetical protein
VQKFTRALTREIELAGQRLALSLDEKGVSVRPVGSRKPPHEITWAALMCHVVKSEGSAAPEAHVLAEAVERLKVGAAKKAPSPEPHPEQPPGPLPAPSAPRSSTAAPPTHALLARLDTWLRTHRPRYADGLLPGATAEELAGLQERVAAALPDDLAALLQWHNGQSLDFAGSFEGSWNLMSTTRIADAKKEFDGGIPFLDDGVGDYLYLDPSQPGIPVREYRVGESNASIVAPNLSAWLREFVTAVEAGAYHADPERGHFLRRRS